jgi:hypothetical protein
MRIIPALIAVLLLIAHPVAASPYAECTDVNLGMTHDAQKVLEPILIPEVNDYIRAEAGSSTTPLTITKVAIRKSFRYQKWSIFYVDTMLTDSVYVFFSGDTI